MSKIGRYSADRKKIETLAANKTVTVANCGTVFVLNSGSSPGGTYTASLPSVIDAGKGWWCKFVIGETTGGDVLISASADDPISMFIHKPMSRNDEIYGFGASPRNPYYGPEQPNTPHSVDFSMGHTSRFWGNMPFVFPNVESAGSVRFTISSSASGSGPFGRTGCWHYNHSEPALYGYVTNVQPSSSCKVNDTLELMTDGVRWYGTVQLHSSVALLDGALNPCTDLYAPTTYYYYKGPPP